MKRGYVDTPEGQVHYRTAGHGKALLLLHRVGLSSDEFTEMIPLLGERYQVIAPDFLGYGESDLPDRELTLEDHTRNISHFMDAMNIKRADIVGARFGGSVGVEMAVTQPARVNKLIIIDFVFVLPEEQQQRVEATRKRYLKIKEDGSHLVELWKSHFSRHYLNVEMCQRAVVDNLRSGLGLRAEDGHVALFSYNIAPRLPAVKSPVLLLSGAAGPFLGRIEAFKSLLPNCQARTIAGTLHVPTWEKPHEFSQAILDFLENP